MQAGVGPGLEYLVLTPEFFQLGHKHLEKDYCTR